MHPAIAFTGLYGPSLASWLFANSDRLGDTFARLSRPIVAAVTDPTASLDRIGSVLVSQQSGQTEVIGLLHRNSDVLHDISTAVDAVQAGQDGIATSLDLLTSMSMVGLGISVLSQATLGIQFLALTRRLKKLATDVQKIKTILQAESRGRLQAGLKKLKNGLGAAADPDQANMYVNAAINTLIDSSANYTELLTS